MQHAERAVLLAGSDLSFVNGQEQSSFPFRHRRGPTALNAAAAAAAAIAIGVDAHSIVESLDTFRGLPHRLEELDEIDGRMWVNDSKATTPEAAVAAIQSFGAPIRLIAGGAERAWI
jgi:UDP-N-acetylmuramoylalanine--D-glutamate ligase